MIDLYSSPTPNGRKISIMLEELGVDFNPILINLDKKEQFSEEFSKISPANKIPVIVDNDNNQTVFESGAILLYLAKKYDKFLDKDKYWEIIQWVFFQMAYVGPMQARLINICFIILVKANLQRIKQKAMHSIYIQF